MGGRADPGMADPAPRRRQAFPHGRLWLALALLFAITPAFFWSGDLFSEEMAGLLRKDWTPRSFLQKTFDPRGGEDFYQGRELSIAIDVLDAQWVRWLMEHDRLLLVPPSGFLASLAFVPIGLWLVPRALPGLGPVNRWLALLVLLSNFVFQSSMGVLFRATKPLIAPLLLALALLALAEYRKPRLAPWAASLWVGGSGLAMGLLDRQGLFYLLCLTLALGVAWLLTRRGLPLLVGAAAACGAWLFYFNLLGARLIHWLNGYWPGLGFQRLRAAALLAGEPWLGAIDLLAAWTSVLFGGLPPALIAALLVGGGLFWAWRARRRPRRVALAAAGALAVAAAQFTAVAMMVERHPPIAWPGSRLWYYPLPFQAAATFGLLWALEALGRGRPRLRSTGMPLALAAIAVLNVLGWPERRAIMNADPPFAEQATNSAVFVRSFRNGLADPQLWGSNRIFFFECLSRFRRLAARARAQAGEVRGFYRSELYQGRTVAWARSDARVVVWAHPAGRYVLAGTAWLRSGERLWLFRKTGLPRFVGEVRRTRPGDGLEHFRVGCRPGKRGQRHPDPLVPPGDPGTRRPARDAGGLPAEAAGPSAARPPRLSRRRFLQCGPPLAWTPGPSAWTPELPASRLSATRGPTILSRATAPPLAFRWLWPALAALLAVAPVVFWGGGVIEEEALGFQRNFWGARPVLQRIFETREFDDFQGRELSYAIDCLDAQWVRATLSRGVFLFVAPSVLMASLALLPIGLWLLPAALPRLEQASAWLLLLLYLGNFAVASTTGLLYRATKPLVAPLVLVLLLLLIAEHRRPRLGPPLEFATVSVISLVLCLLDRQGLFYVLVLLPVLGLVWLRARRGLARTLAAASALLVCGAYNEWLGPWLIHALNGYWPDRSFQRLDPLWLLAPGPWLAALRLLGDWTSVLFGGLPPLLLATAALVLASIWAWRERRCPRRVAAVLAAAALAVVMQTTMVALMIARYRTVTQIDHRFWYYPLPYQALLVAGLLVGLERWTAARGGRLPRAVPLVLAALLAGNLLEWPAHRVVMQSGPWFSGVARGSALLVGSLRSGRPAPLLDGEYRRFYFECLALFPRLGARAGTYVAEGNGVGLARFREGRLLAPVRREAHVPVTAARAGRHVLVGSAFLAPGTTLEVLLGPRPLAQLGPGNGERGAVPFRVPAELAAGRSDLVLRVRRQADAGEDWRRFSLQLPVLVWRDERPRSDTIIFSTASRGPV